MSSNIEYEVIPMSDREHTQKVLSILEKKYSKEVTKKVTLNERFGVLEKGYCLHHVARTENVKETPVYFRVHDRHLISKTDFIENYLAHNPVKSNESSPSKFDVEDKENAPKIVEKSKKLDEDPVDKPFSIDAYVRDISQNMQKSQ